jgi:hypothetical protein
MRYGSDAVSDVSPLTAPPVYTLRLRSRLESPSGYLARIRVTNQPPPGEQRLFVPLHSPNIGSHM